MPFKSVKQAKYMAINQPEIFKRWKEKYGLPKGFSAKEQKTVPKAGDYDISTKFKASAAHEAIHKNYSSSDWAYYRKMHRKVVEGLHSHGLSHYAYNGDILDEMLSGKLRRLSKWKDKEE